MTQTPAAPPPGQQPSPSGATAPAPAGPTHTRPRGTSRLPWLLSGLLGLLCLALIMALGWRTNQVTSLRQQLAEAEAARSAQPAATSPTSGTGGQPTTAASTRAGAPVITPQPTTGEQAQRLMALAKRDPADPLAKGKPDAPIVMIEWADYRCPFCAKFSLETRPQLQPYIDSGSLRIEFHDLVLFGEESQLAAKAARAAGQQGKYFQFADQIWRLHTGQGHPTVTSKEITTAAQKVGLDMTAFSAALNDPALDEAVKADTAQATSLGLNATPFFLVNTTPVSGALPTESFVTLLEAYGAKK